MAAIPKGKGEIGKDMVVLFEDQQKINLFAKKNSLLNDIKDQITEKERIFKNVEDAADELILFDDDQMVPYPFHLDHQRGAAKVGGLQVGTAKRIRQIKRTSQQHRRTTFQSQVTALCKVWG
uniref:Uncharacterized protein n=1 Tax=Amphimedon queenslandica TaxID=400682 RepID=A0A1X7V5R3_AMPQE